MAVRAIETKTSDCPKQQDIYLLSEQFGNQRIKALVLNPDPLIGVNWLENFPQQ